VKEINEQYHQKQLESLLGLRVIRYFDSVDSTNDIAMMLLQEGAPEGTVVIADEQRNGRGRTVDGIKRIWHTPPGVAVALSLVLRPTTTKTASQLAMLGAVAVSTLLMNRGIHNTTIKWPNDVLVGGKKICGILPELLWDGNKLVGAVLGIGLNVRNDFTGTDYANTATTLEAAGGRVVDRADVVSHLVQALEYHRKYQTPEQLFSLWRLRIEGLRRSIQINNINGTVQDVGSDGSLIVLDHHGKMHRVMSGDVHL
jgi:BirA family transcriptional regulator, biotin operon repressor / biotin---[acetyl-CoA-carboxylase] ligase